MSMEGFPNFIKPKNIAKAVAGASLLIAASGEVPNAYGCDEKVKPTTEQTSAGDEKRGLDFFNTTNPKPSEAGICSVVGIKNKLGATNNKAAEKVETTNLNQEKSQVSEEFNQNNFLKKDESENVTTRSISEIR